jgi:hypothetical protein
MVILLQDFQNLLLPHLAYEEALVSAENLHRFFRPEVVEVVRLKILERVAAMDETIFLPLMVTNLDEEARKKMFFEEESWFFRNISLPLRLRRNRSWWRFSKYTL